jgi:hypothetical protein
MVIARSYGSPILDRAITGLGLRYTQKTALVISIPPSLMADVEELGRHCREGLSRDGVRLNEGLNRLVKLSVFTQYFCAAIMPGLATAQLAQSREGFLYPSRADDIDSDLGNGPGGVIQQSTHYHGGHAWLEEIAKILVAANGDRGSGLSERPKHVLIIAATPSLTGHLTVILRSHQPLKGIVAIHRISSRGNGPARDRDSHLKQIQHRALKSQKTHVVITHHRSCGNRHKRA